MTKHEKIANIVAFLTILFGEDEEMNTIMKFNPSYIIEKFDRYVESTTIEYPWGMHPALRNNIFHRYMDKWKLELKDE
jgi:hypothetical protein